MMPVIYRINSRGLTEDEKELPYIAITIEVPEEDDYEINISYIEKGNGGQVAYLIEDYFYGVLYMGKQEEMGILKVVNTPLKKGTYVIKFINPEGRKLHIESLSLHKGVASQPHAPDFKLNNPKALPICKAIIKYFNTIYGKQIISGQHTNFAKGTQLDYIYEVTGKYPAIRGFDLMSYTEGAITKEASEHCLLEVVNNRGTVEEIIEWWHTYKGIPAVCWHWFSPLTATDKSFYTRFTSFDLEKALVEGTKENRAMMRDIDAIARQLLLLQSEGVPILWRPLHEADGTWFWWGAKGAEAYKKLYRLIHDRYTHHFGLNNLIWVWNAPQPQWYVGDDYCDLAGNDVYGPLQNYGPLKGEFDKVRQCITGDKPIALTESFIIPDPEKLIDSQTKWLFYMTWNWEEEAMILENMTKAHMQKVYNHPYVITLEDLPDFKYFMD